MPKRRPNTEPWTKYVGQKVEFIKGDHLGKVGRIVDGWYDTCTVVTFEAETITNVPIHFLTKSLCNTLPDAQNAGTSEPPSPII